MADLATIGFGVDTASLNAGDQALQRLGASARQIASIIEREMAKTGVATGMYARGLKEAEQAQRTYSPAVVRVTQDLAFQTAQLQRSSREQAIHNSLRAASVDANTKEGIAISLLAGRHHDMSTALSKATVAQQAFQSASTGSIAAIAAVAFQFGRAHPIITSFSVAMGLATVASVAMDRAALALANRAGQLRDFSETTGFNVVQLQALEKAAAQVGVSSDSMTRGLERFSRQMVDVRKATGDTYEQLAGVDIQLARQVARTESLAEAWDLVSKAIKAAPLEEANKIAVAFFGREGISQTRLMRAGAEAGGITGLVSQLNVLDVITKKQAERWDELGDKIAENMKAAKQNVVSIFVEPSLEALERLSGSFLSLTRAIKGVGDAQPGGFWKGLMADLREPRTITSLNHLYEILTRVRTIGESAGASVAAIAGRIPQMESPGAVPFRTGPDMVAHRNAEKEANDKLTASLVRLSNEEKKRMEVLGPAATAQEKYNATLKEMQALRGERPDLADEARRRIGAAAIELENTKLAGRVGLLGDLARAEDVVRQKQLAIEAANRDGADISERQTKALLERARIQHEASVPEKQVELQREMLFLTESEGRIRQQMIGWGIDIKGERGQALASQMRMNDVLKETTDLTKQFAKDLITGLTQGKSLMDALGNAATALSSKLTSSALDSLLVGDFAGAAVKGVGALISGFIGKQSEKQKQQQEAMKSAIERSQQFSDRARAAGLDTNVRADAVVAFQMKAQREIQEEWKQGGRAIVALTEAHNAELLALNMDFDKRELEATRAAEEERLKMIEEARAKMQGIERQVNDLTNRGFLNQFSDLFKEVEEARRAAPVAGGDTSIIERFFGLKAQDIIDEADIVGSAFEDLLNIFPDLRGVVREATASIEEQVAAQNRLNDIAKSIVEYVNSLQAGPESFMSPQQRLLAAQASYGSQLALAQGGNVDAQAGITKFADDLIKAARDFYGSTTAFQNILDAVKSQLLALPAVTAATDPVVVALAEVVTAVNATTGAVDAGNLFLDYIKDFTDATSANTASQATLQATQNNLITSANTLTGTTNVLLDSIEGLLDQIKTLNSTANTTLGFVKTGTDRLTDVVTHLDAIHHNSKFYWDSDQNFDGVFSQAHAQGGWVRGPGTSTSDSVRARLSNGEFVVNARSAAANADLLAAINSGGSMSESEDGEVAGKLAQMLAILSRIANYTYVSAARSGEIVSGMASSRAVQVDSNKLERRQRRRAER